MSSEQDQTVPSTLNDALQSIALSAIAHASLVVAFCILAGVLSGKGVELYLRTAVLAFSLVGSFALGRAIKAEQYSAYNEAGNLYGSAFVSHFVAYASMMAYRLLANEGF